MISERPIAKFNETTAVGCTLFALRTDHSRPPNWMGSSVSGMLRSVS
jgi:hypothetical protein